MSHDPRILETKIWSSLVQPFGRFRTAAVVIVVIAGLGISACASFEGSPKYVVAPATEEKNFAPYLTGDVIKAFYSADSKDRGGLTPRQWRDAVIGARIKIADLRYEEFRKRLNTENTALNVGIDWAVLGLSGAAAVATQGAANALSAASAGLTGAGASFSKDALYQKTLPALYAQMDANRSKVLVTIRSAQERPGVDAYPLEVALHDLDDYAEAGTIERAIAVITTAATNEKTTRDDQLKVLYTGSIVPTEIRVRRVKFDDWVRSHSEDETKLKAIGGLLGLTPSLSDPNHIILIVNETVLTKDKMDALSKNLKSITNEDF